MNNGFINWTAYSCDAVAEAGGEYILQNDLPDVRKIVHVCSQIKKNECYLEGQTASAEGTVGYSVLYVGDDGDLHNSSYEAAFSAKTQLRDGDGAEVCDAVFMPADTQVRLANPRKFSIRSRIPVAFTVYSRREWEPFIDGVQDAGLQYDGKSGCTFDAAQIKENDIPYAEDLRIPEQYPEPDRLLYGCVAAGIPTVTPSDGSAEITFAADVMTVYLTEESIPVSYKTSVTVTHTVDDDAVKAGSVCRASVYVTDPRFSLTTDKSGQLRTVELDLSYSLSLLCETKNDITYIADMFSTEKESSASYKELTLRRAVLPYTTHITVSGEAEGRPDTRIVLATAECGAVTAETENGQTVCEGDIQIYTVYEENGVCESGALTVPFRAVLPYAVPDGASYSVTAAVGIPSVRADGGKIYSDVELYVRLTGEQTETVNALSVFKISDTPLYRDKVSLRVYKPRGQSLWEVAKRFKVPVNELAAANEDVSGGVLIIP
ncbi:MAG: hypothetical protein J6330_08585 [Clostridia bacterium]|nr:hypothetical protein [Clostridia bacterium]